MNPYNETQDGKCAKFVKQSEKTIAEIVQKTSCTSQMTPEQQRIAIAKACGWRNTPFGAPIEQHPKTWRSLSDLPDYLNDLNAMHEAEKMLDVDKWQRRDYLDYLNPDNDQWALVHATAAQRAEAFLRTLNLWNP